MSTLISDSYLNEQVYLHYHHPRKHKYGSGGPQWANTINAIIAENGCKTVIDYGCGKGILASRLSGVEVQSYDPAIPEFSALPTISDLVVCLDVLEHIEPDCIDVVLDHIVSLAHKLVFVTISQKSAGRFLRDGRNSHLLIKETAWWVKKFKDRKCEIEKTFPPQVTEYVALVRVP
jgi:2-polyprenyl-3-methyl-5-hydroxy-6-metoxy-1,4-benzoquinol methylase